MEMIINSTILLAEIQREFNKEFTFLKVEFHTSRQKNNLGFKPHSQDVYRTVGECGTVTGDAILVIHKTHTAQYVEDHLWDAFGLASKVLRKSGSLWIEISLSNTWTLEKQNKVGMELSNHEQDDDILVS